MSRENKNSTIIGKGAYQAPPKSFWEKVFRGDKVMWVIIVILLIYSLFVVYSTTAYDLRLDANQELTKQMLYICIGMAGFFFMQSLHWRKYRGWIKYIYWASIVLTICMLAFYTGNNAARSLNIAGFEFQPFEMLKISVIMLLADQLAKRQKNIDKIDIVPPFKKQVWFGDSQELWAKLHKDTIPVLGPIVLACCVTLLTSNSTTFIIAISCLAMLFIGRVKMADIKRIIILGICIGVPALLLFGGRVDTLGGRFAGYSPIMFTKSAVVAGDGKEYYKRPAHETDQTMYAKMSIASGGIKGKGPGKSTNRYLQEADKDMAYAFLIEEYGLIFGALIILMAYLIMFYRTIEIFRRCGTAFPGLVVLGVGTAIVIQAFLHMLVSVSILPVTGQQLPIVSKGGSSLVFTLAALGIIMGISAQAEEGTLDVPKSEKKITGAKE